MNPSETTTPPAISTDELREAMGLDPATSLARLYGEAARALRFFDGAQSEMQLLLAERAQLKQGTMGVKQLERRGLLQPDGQPNLDAIAQRLIEIDSAIALIFNEVVVITARAGFDRALAGARWDAGRLPTEEQLRQFFLLRDARDSSQPFPESLDDWGKALSLPKPTKADVLSEISRRTKDRRARIEAKFAADTAALINLTAARVFAAIAAQAEGRLDAARLEALSSAWSPSWAIITAKRPAAALLSVAPQRGVKSFGMGGPLILSGSW